MILRKRARLGRAATRPRGASGENRLWGRLKLSKSGAGRTRRRPRAGALPATGRYRATVTENPEDRLVALAGN